MKFTQKGQFSAGYEKSEALFAHRAIRYSARMILLLIFSLIFKSFDLSFVQAADNPARAYVFSTVYVLFGFFAWEGALVAARRIEKGAAGFDTSYRLLFLCAALILYGVLVAFGFAFAYGVTDILLFNRYEAWESLTALSYDLIFGTFLFYLLMLAFNGIIFYYKEWKEYQVQTERLQRENIQAKYDALRNQVDPHFLFNSLSVLTNLVYKSADLSAEYITQLARIYRYILDTKFENLVPLETELEFLNAYLFLIGIRHQNCINFSADIPEAVKHRAMIPPATLQMLVENAIKHNRFSIEDPLHISIRNEDGYLLVSNTRKEKQLMESTPGVGLDNIHKRYELISSKPVQIRETAHTFQVNVPLIPAS